MLSSPRHTPQETRSMPSAVPSDAESLLPKARMIDPRGHRFGAGLSAILLIGAVVADVPAVVALVLLSIGASAAFGLKYSIYGAIWRRLAKALQPPEGRARARIPAALRAGAGQRRADPLAHRLRAWRHHRRVGPGPRGCRAPDAAGDDRLLPRLPAVLPALVGAGSRDADLDPGRSGGPNRALAPQPITYR